MEQPSCMRCCCWRTRSWGPLSWPALWPVDTRHLQARAASAEMNRLDGGFASALIGLWASRELVHAALGQ